MAITLLHCIPSSFSYTPLSASRYQSILSQNPFLEFECAVDQKNAVREKAMVSCVEQCAVTPSVGPD
jgi:hypothetical protein